MTSKTNSTGAAMHDLMRRLFPINRSLTGDGVRQTLDILGEHIPLNIHEVPTGTQAFDWTVPQEWRIREAWIKDLQGNTIVDFQDSNLHIWGYSTPVDAVVSRRELLDHIRTLPELPQAIPYVTTYYNRNWGFCLSHQQIQDLNHEQYRVFIDSELFDGHLTYADLVIPGRRQQEVLFTTYTCHPSMANNELSGPVVNTFLARWLLQEEREYTYRFVFAPETIGAIVYLSRHLEHLKQHMVWGSNVSCVGDHRAHTLIHSRQGDTYADKLMTFCMAQRGIKHVDHPYLLRGSDERQYCSPGVDLPYISFSRTAFDDYPEYHSSLDNLDFVSPEGLETSLEFLQFCIRVHEANRRWKVTCLCEPQMGKRNLYPKVATRDTPDKLRKMKDFLAFADGENDVLDICSICNIPFDDTGDIISRLLEAQLLTEETATPARKNT